MLISDDYFYKITIITDLLYGVECCIKIRVHRERDIRVEMDGGVS